MPTTSIRIDDELNNKLEKLASSLNRKKGWIIKEAIAQYVGFEEKKQQRYFDTLEALEDVKDGNVISSEDVFKWMDTWGSDAELPPPLVKNK